MCELETFDYEVHYVKGKDNSDVDYLSRLNSEASEEVNLVLACSEEKALANAYPLHKSKPTKPRISIFLEPGSSWVLLQGSEKGYTKGIKSCLLEMESFRKENP